MSASLLREIDTMVERRRWLSLSLYFILVFICAGWAYGATKSVIVEAKDYFEERNLQLSDASVETERNTPQGANNVDTKKIAGAAIVESSIFDEKEWRMLGFSKMKDKNGLVDYWCAQVRPGFKMSEMWQKNKKMKIDDVLKIQFSLKKGEDWREGMKEPKLVLLYGRKNDGGTYYSLFVPDEEINRVGFEDNSFSRVAWPKNILANPLDISEENIIDLQYAIGNPQANDASFSYKLGYTVGVRDGDEIKRVEVNPEGAFQRVFPWPSPKKSGLEQEFGLGLYPGTCLKIISYQNPKN